ncbi:MAG: hypothetical protein AAGF79_05630 [Pseudomonadota bacterium]
MKTKRRFIQAMVIGSIGAVGASALPNAALAQECAPFEVFAKDWKRGVYPDGEAVVGTKRAGTRRLHDESGEGVGLYTYAATVVEVQENGETILNVTRTWTLQDGTLVGVGMIAHPDAVDINVQPDQIGSVVVGGTGVFRGAHGSVEMRAPNGDGDRMVSFDISCD